MSAPPSSQSDGAQPTLRRPQVQFRQSSSNSIGIRRLAPNIQPSRGQTPQTPLGRVISASASDPRSSQDDDDHVTGRRRSMSAPSQGDSGYSQGRHSGSQIVGIRPESGVSQASRPLSGGTVLQDITEGVAMRNNSHRSNALAELEGSVPQPTVPRTTFSGEGVPQRHGSGSRRIRSATTGDRPTRSRAEMSEKLQRGRSEMSLKRGSKEYQSSVVDVLDVVDPYVSTLTTINNVQNSLFVPNLGRWLNRRPTYDLPDRPEVQMTEMKEAQDMLEILDNSPENIRPGSWQENDQASLVPRRTISRASITSQLSASHFAVLPHGVSIDDWSKEDRDLLNDHVRHLLHSRKEKFRRSMRAFRNYVRKPLGLFVTVYAFLVTTFGLVWVLFLIGWISGGDKHEYDINVIDNVLVGLFALIGDVLAPFRAVDTYHMIYIMHYHRLTWKIRQREQLPNLADPNDLPTIDRSDLDLEAAFKRDMEDPVLSPAQQLKLEHHQGKFASSHTFYRPHETETHFAYPVRILLLVVILLDLHSIFQIALGSLTWGWSYHTRPQWITAVVLALSLTCNISGGIWISIGDKRSRKKDVLERMFRQEITKEAMERIEEARRAAEGKSARPYSGT